MSKLHTSDINLTVELDENRIPEKLKWTAKDGGVDNEEAKAMLLSIWDANNQETLRIDLWTKDMPVDQMKVFFIKPFLQWQILMNELHKMIRWQLLCEIFVSILQIN